MEPEHHHGISAIGEQVLKAALEAGNPGRKLRLGAFYLGNWISDFSQGVDPQLYAKLGELATPPDVERLFRKLVHDAPSWIRGPLEGSDLVERLRRAIGEARKEVVGHLQGLIGAGRSGTLARAVKDVVMWKGYFDLVHPKRRGEPPRMDPASFFHVYDRLFQQYLPHLHVDRPAVRDGVYEDTPARGPRNKHTRPPERCQGDLYDYLREAIEITAGKIAYLDGGVPDGEPRLSWAAATFHPARRHFTDETGKTCPVDDADPSWNYHLALLGQALHAVEDYFAHSTFAEHASLAIPKDVQRYQRAEEQEILARRLKRWQPGLEEDRWQELPNDAHVATGFFGSRDGLISLLHKLEHALGLGRDKVGKRMDDVVEYDYQRLFEDVLDLKSDFRGAWRSSDPKAAGYDKDKANQAAAWLRKKYDEGLFGNLERLADGDEKVNRYADFFIDQMLPAETPPRVREAMKRASDLLGRVKAGFGVYKSMKSLVEFLRMPLAYLGKFIVGKVDGMLVDVLEAYLVDAIERQLGSRNIGSHSLIAKDTGSEAYFKPALQCARAVHWYIMHTLARHGRPREVQVCRTGEALSHVNNLYCSRFVDWLELLEYFLCNPRAELQVVHEERAVVASIIHVTAEYTHSRMSGDTLENLALRYRPKAHVVDPVTGEPVPMGRGFTWETIADANFPTKGLSTEERMRQVNKVLAHQPRNAMIVRDGINYAFRPGVPVVIPFQSLGLSRVTTNIAQRRWWYPIMTTPKDDAWKRLPNHGASEGCTPNPADGCHSPIPVSHGEVLTLVRRSE